MSSFYINLPIGGSSLFALLWLFSAPPSSQPAEATLKEKIVHMDITGIVLIICALICYLLALQWGGISKSWSSSEVIAMLTVSGVLLILFCLAEVIQGDKAMMAPRIIKQRTVAASSAFIFL